MIVLPLPVLAVFGAFAVRPAPHVMVLFAPIAAILSALSIVTVFFDPVTARFFAASIATVLPPPVIATLSHVPVTL